jgi:hypothetical protein
MTPWDHLASVVNDPNYFHGGPGTEPQFFGLYNVTFDRILIISYNLYILKQIKKLYQYQFPTIICCINEDIDNSCCGCWTVETPTPSLHAANDQKIVSGKLIHVGPPDNNIEDYLEMQKDLLKAHAKLNEVLLRKPVVD